MRRTVCPRAISAVTALRPTTPDPPVTRTFMARRQGQNECHRFMPMKIETLAARAGHAPDATGAVAPPIHMSTTYEREPDGSYRAGFIYSRYANPNRNALESAIASLEGGAVGLCFASGSSATMTVIQAL